ncbi:hypothetical protein [Tautonia sociabilis]|uniref:Uncharacterized protein n=1 Tax=Tautonia sociabilis TaxID=2080755 RepID=A0A432MDP3_9BACT|nr:hypothetical protein [Tautonia sociabilis]RUL82956.1 hypothetical protein TsocGM_22930 [Tautonia sociabilis]
MGDAIEPGRREGRLRLAFWAAFWRIALFLAVLGELALWAAIRRQAVGFPPRVRLAFLVVYSPRVLVSAALLAGLITQALDVLVRLAVDPMLRRWLQPATDRDDDDGRGFGFHLDATERVADARPARMRVGRGSRPGTLVLTDRRLWFFPSAWDGEPWSVPRDGIRSASLDPPPPALARVVRGLPPQVVVSGGAGPESRATFALADPSAVLRWFLPEPAAR